MNKNDKDLDKILIISLEYPPQIGGIASYVYNFVENVQKSIPIVLTTKSKIAESFDKNQNIKIYRKNFYWFFWPRWIGVLYHAFRVVRREKIKKIFIHHCLPIGYVGYILNFFLKIDYYIFFHGTDLEMATIKKLKIFKTKKVLKRAKKVIFNSEFLQNKFLERIEGIDEKKMLVLYPCPGEVFFMDIKKEEVKELKDKYALVGKKVILTVARISEGKGYPHLIRILPEILKKVPNLVWLIVGTGRKEKIIFDMIQKNYLQNVVRFLGNVEYDLLPKIYSLADLFVLLSHKDENHEEAWGTVFLEAGAVGLPVVAGKVGGVSEAVKDKITGILVNPYEDKQIIENISGLLLNSDFAKEIGQNAKNRIQDEFRWHFQINKLLKD